MAKYESEIKTRIGTLADYLHNEILKRQHLRKL